MKRGEKEFTQQDLADLSGASRRAIQDFEAGKRWPRADTIGNLEHALGWHRGYLADLAAKLGTSDGEEDLAEQQIMELPYLLDHDREMFLRVYRDRKSVV